MLCFAVLGKLVLSMKDVFVRGSTKYTTMVASRTSSLMPARVKTNVVLLPDMDPVSEKEFGVNLGSRQYLLSANAAVNHDVFLSILLRRQHRLKQH